MFLDSKQAAQKPLSAALAAQGATASRQAALQIHRAARANSIPSQNPREASWDETLIDAAHEVEHWAHSIVGGIEELEDTALEFAHEVGKGLGRELGAASLLAARAGHLAAEELRRERQLIWAQSVRASRVVSEKSVKMGWKAKALASALAVALSTVAWQSWAQKSMAKPAGSADALSLLADSSAQSLGASWAPGQANLGSSNPESKKTRLASAFAFASRVASGSVLPISVGQTPVSPYSVGSLLSRDAGYPWAAQETSFARWQGGAVPTLLPLGAGLKARPLASDPAGPSPQGGILRVSESGAELSSALAGPQSAPSPLASLAAPSAAAASLQEKQASVDGRVSASFSGGELTMLAAPSGGIGLRQPTDERAAMTGLSQQLAQEFKVDPTAVASWTHEATKQAQARGIEPTLALAVISVESRFQAAAKSKGGAVGLMQVILHYHPAAVKEVGGAQKAASPLGNIAVGLSALDEARKMSDKRGGGWSLALSYYNGSSNDPTRAYARRVLKEKARIEAMLQAQKSKLASSQYAQANART